jgi:hypothetical protein
MSDLSVNTPNGFNSNSLWISNTSQSSNEGFLGLENTTGNILTGPVIQHFSEFSFQANGSIYHYVGDWPSHIRPEY